MCQILYRVCICVHMLPLPALVRVLVSSELLQWEELEQLVQSLQTCAMGECLIRTALQPSAGQTCSVCPDWELYSARPHCSSSEPAACSCIFASFPPAQSLEGAPTVPCPPPKCQRRQLAASCRNPSTLFSFCLQLSPPLPHRAPACKMRMVEGKGSAGRSDCCSWLGRVCVPRALLGYLSSCRKTRVGQLRSCPHQRGEQAVLPQRHSSHSQMHPHNSRAILPMAAVTHQFFLGR